MWSENNGNFGAYTQADINLNGDVNGADKGIWFENNGISSSLPK